jgi:hypothetical protein
MRLNSLDTPAYYSKFNIPAHENYPYAGREHEYLSQPDYFL